MAQALQIKFGADTSGAQQALQSLATTVAKNATSISGSLLNVVQNTQKLNVVWQQTNTAGDKAIGTLLRVGPPVLVAAAAFYVLTKAISAATDLAKERIDDITKLAEKAASVNVSTDFYQRISKGAESVKLSADDASAALQKLIETSAGALGGSSLSNRIAELQSYGNLQGNGGVGQLKAANTAEDQFRAVVRIIDEAMEKGERLAALDIAGHAFGPTLQNALRTNAGVLDEMLRAADALSSKDLISPEEVGRANDLKSRLDAAQNTLANKYKPILDDFAKLGVSSYEGLIGMYEQLAKIAGQVVIIYNFFKDIDATVSKLNGSIVGSLTQKLGITSDPAKPDASGVSGDDLSNAYGRLRAGLQTPGAVAQAQRQATEIASAVRGDTSKPPPVATATTQNLDAVERYISSLERQRDVEQAELSTLGQSNQVRQQAIDLANAERAAREAKRPLTEDEIAKVKEYASEVARLQDSVAARRPLADFARDAQNVGKSLSEAGVSGLRGFEDALISVGQGTQTVAQAFTSMANSILADLERILIRKAITGPLANALGGLFGAPSGGGILLGNAALGLPGNAAGTDSWRGGLSWVGEQGPELLSLPAGARITPNNKLGGGGPSVTVQQTITFTGGVNGNDMAVIRQQIAEAGQQTQAATVQALRRGMANDSGFLGR